MNNNDYPSYDEEQHRFYRMIGNSVEYEPEIVSTQGTVTKSELKEINETIKKYNVYNAAKSLREVREQKLLGACPFKGNGLYVQCNKDCAWWSEPGCRLVCKGHTNELKGTCPISKISCRHDCVFYKNNDCDLISEKASG